MRSITRRLVIGLLLSLTACARETKNIGSPQPPCRFVIYGIALSPQSSGGGYVAGTDLTVRVELAGCEAPYTVTLDSGKGATPSSQTVTVEGRDFPAAAVFNLHLDDFLLADDADGRQVALNVTAVDAHGTSASAGASLYVYGFPDQPTVISAVSNADCTITVTVADPENEDVAINATSVPLALTINTSKTVVPGGHGTVEFSFGAANLLAGGSGSVDFSSTTAADGIGQTASATVTCPPITLAADTLYAIPLKTAINAGERVRIVVATGDPASPFRYMTGVRITVPQAADALYVGGTAAAGGTSDIPASLNAGAVGGQPGDIDGLWLDLGATVFLLPPDSFFQRSDAGGGLHGFDFNLTPLDGTDLDSGSGELFNIELEFNVPGVWTLGFQDFNVVPRTYYQDSNQSPDYFWGDITNNHPGVPNTVTVL